jgi:hypothetical protein
LRGWNLAAQAEGAAYVIKSKLRGIALHVRYRPRGLSMAGDMWCGIDGVVSNALGSQTSGWEVDGMDGRMGKGGCRTTTTTIDAVILCGVVVYVLRRGGICNMGGRGWCQGTAY